MTCGGKQVHTWPAYGPRWSEAVPQCRQLVRDVVRKAKVWNMLLGVQMFYDWREASFGCKLIELNLRPHDWPMLADHSWSMRHAPEDYFDYGAAMLYLAFDLDPSPLRLRVPPEYSSAVIALCPVSTSRQHFGTGGIFTHEQLYHTWIHEKACEVKIAPSSDEALEQLTKWPCLNGPEVHSVGTELENLCLRELNRGEAWWSVDTNLLKTDVRLFAKPKVANREL